MSKKIMVIDRDPDILEIMEIALVYEGFGVVTSKAAEGYETLIRQHEVDLVIIEYLLNGADGGEICQQIKCHPEFGHLPVIIYSAYPRSFQSAASYSCDAFIPKPFDLADIVGEITSLLHCSSNNIYSN